MHSQRWRLTPHPSNLSVVKIARKRSRDVDGIESMSGRRLLPIAPWRLLGGASAALPILMYHRVLEALDPLQDEVHTTQVLERQFATLSRWFKVLPLDEAVQMLQEGRLPARAVCLTFDDGYRDNHDLALPLLQRHGLTATFYVTSGLLNGGVMFHDLIAETVRHAPSGRLDIGVAGVPAVELSDAASRVRAVATLTPKVKYLDVPQRLACTERMMRALGSRAPRHLMMDDAHVTAMSRAGMGIGGHTVNHQILAKLSDEDAAREIEQNRQDLASLVDKPLTSFAYPNGKPVVDYNEQTIRHVKASGYRHAVATTWGISTAASKPFELPRFVLNESTPLSIVKRLLRMSVYPA